jgi:hypothetical protein
VLCARESFVACVADRCLRVSLGAVGSQDYRGVSNDDMSWQGCELKWSLPDLMYNSAVRFEVFTAVTMKNGVFWDVTSCGSCKNRCFGGT